MFLTHKNIVGRVESSVHQKVKDCCFASVSYLSFVFDKDILQWKNDFKDSFTHLLILARFSMPKKNPLIIRVFFSFLEK